VTAFSIASFNTKNLIGADQEYYPFESYSPEEFAWKRSWLAAQLVAMKADIVGFQEVFAPEPLEAVIAEADARGAVMNAAAIPPPSSPYGRKSIFRKLEYSPYGPGKLFVAPNIHDGEPGNRRPGVALLSRFGFSETPQVIQGLDQPLDIPFRTLEKADSGHYRLTSLSRPVIKARIPVGDMVVTVFNCHLKSKLGEYIRPAGAAIAPEEDLLTYDPLGRALGSLRSGVRRMAEAWVLRRAIVAEIEAGHPVMVLGDFNDSENAVSTEIIRGETPFFNYAWVRRAGASRGDDRYSTSESDMIQTAITRLRLQSAEDLFVRKSLRDMVFTSAFGGVYESIDQIFLSRHFQPDNPDRIGGMDYFTVLNDHISDGSHPEAPNNKLASDHGQIVAHMRIGPDP
jgi:endonuclease/exonuclease/phosphatase family metal-dependent hydrolase